MTSSADYGNWVSWRLIYIPGLIDLLLLALALLYLMLLVPAVLFLSVSAYFAYVQHLFAPMDGDVRNRIRELEQAMPLKCDPAMTLGRSGKTPSSSSI